MAEWPASAEAMKRAQEELARAEPPPWSPPERPLAIGGCFVCFGGHGPGPGSRGDPAWAGAVVIRAGRVVATAAVEGEAGAPYEAGLLALREGAVLESAVRELTFAPDVLLVNAAGRDHPRRAGLALSLGSVLELPSVGVTHRPLLAEGPWPDEKPGSTAPLSIAGEVVGSWLRARRNARPLAVNAAWRTDLDTAAQVVIEAVGKARTPEPLREARRLARTARAVSLGTAPAPAHSVRAPGAQRS
jgi:deoxyribonuclease V